MTHEPQPLPEPVIDGHVHLNALKDPEAALAEARRAGVCAVIAVGMDIRSNRQILELARHHPGFVFPGLGYHPWEIRPEKAAENLAFLGAHVQDCVALGEVGLDYRIKVPRKLQQRILEEIAALAVCSGRPLILHGRYAHSRAFEIVRAAGIRRAVFHWYTDSAELLDRILDAGYFISATPALSYSPPHQAAVRRAPLERILLETDAPVVFQGRPSVPADVRITLAEVARIKNRDPRTVAAVTRAQTAAFFGLARPDL